ncbi:MAG TPA: FKBP-type peptidyl-prolyl cis-trans isomerase [Thermoanaerobaculia bacterium]|nr:FKBP-type peptidyl-prolyl cis-trans isomerase [Thermoanaerobaculia bacterium]
MRRTLPALVLLPLLAYLVTSAAAAPASSSLATEVPLAAPPPEAEVAPLGFASLVLAPGSGATRPSRDDRVALHVVGRTSDGEELMNSRGAQPGVLDLSKVAPIWREALLLMVEGETRRVWIPAHLAPPDPHSGQRRPIVFDFELLDILEPAAAPGWLRTPPADAERTPSGALTVRLEDGTGTAHPTRRDAALLRYTGRTADGEVFDATSQRGRPTLVPLEKVIPAFAECVERMVEGEKRRCWIPGEVARGQWVGSPEGDLVFDLRLISFTPTDDILVD